MKRIVVAGSSGFIGGHLVRFLKSQGHQVFGMDIIPPQYEWPTEFFECDLRKESLTEYTFQQIHNVDEVYNLACLMGGMGFIGNPTHDYEIMVGSTRIITSVLECCRKLHVPKSFFSSSACVYNMTKQETADCSLTESDAYPAMPDLVYGWQKLFAEQMYLTSRLHGIDVRIARFHNIFGPEGTYEGGKEKAPAAICRKVSAAEDGTAIDVWGNGNQQRSFLYIDECIEGIDRLMQSQVADPINIGSDQMVTINQLAKMVIDLSGKNLRIENSYGPRGVFARSSDNSYIRNRLGWAPSKNLFDGLKTTYAWIDQQVNR